MEIDCNLHIKLNKNDHTASVIQSPSADKSVFIPKTIEHEGEIYKITLLGRFAFSNSGTKYITIPEDSYITTIEYHSFYCSQIKEIQIPANLETLQSGWIGNNEVLTKVDISPQNKNFSYIDNKILFGKINKKSESFDTIYFCRRDLTQITIPSFIKLITSESFFRTQLNSISFEENSSLEIIEKDSFCFNKSLKKLILPSSLLLIGDEAFYGCEFITSILVHSEEIKFSSGCFCNCKNLTFITFPNAKKIVLYNDSFERISDNHVITVPCDCTLDILDFQAEFI